MYTRSGYILNNAHQLKEDCVFLKESLLISFIPFFGVPF